MAMTNNQDNVRRHQERDQHKIGPVKKDALHAEMHIPDGKPIPTGRLDSEKAIAKKDGNTKLEERVNFALNARNWHHR